MKIMAKYLYATVIMYIIIAAIYFIWIHSFSVQRPPIPIPYPYPNELPYPHIVPETSTENNWFKDLFSSIFGKIIIAMPLLISVIGLFMDKTILYAPGTDYRKLKKDITTKLRHHLDTIFNTEIAKKEDINSAIHDIKELASHLLDAKTDLEKRFLIRFLFSIPNNKALDISYNYLDKLDTICGGKASDDELEQSQKIHYARCIIMIEKCLTIKIDPKVKDKWRQHMHMKRLSKERRLRHAEEVRQAGIRSEEIRKQMQAVVPISKGLIEIDGKYEPIPRGVTEDIELKQLIKRRELEIAQKKKDLADNKMTPEQASKYLKEKERADEFDKQTRQVFFPNEQPIIISNPESEAIRRTQEDVERENNLSRELTNSANEIYKLPFFQQKVFDQIVFELIKIKEEQHSQLKNLKLFFPDQIPKQPIIDGVNHNLSEARNNAYEKMMKVGIPIDLIKKTLSEYDHTFTKFNI